MTATTPSSGYFAASSLRKAHDAVLGGEEILAAGRPRRGAHPIPGRPTGIGGERVEAASGPGPEIDFVQRVSHLHGQLEPSRDRLGGSRSRARAGSRTRPRCFSPRGAARSRPPAVVRPVQASRPACGRRGCRRPGRARRGGRDKGSSPPQWTPRGSSSPAMKRAVRSRASLSVNCCGGDFMK